MSQLIVPSKKTLIAVAAIAFVVFVVMLWRYLATDLDTPGVTFSLIAWAVALLVCFESIILIRQAKRPFHMGIYTFALIYAVAVVILHWFRGGLS